MNNEAKIEKANKIIEAVRALNDKAASACKVWAKGDIVRIYTDGKAYVQINDDLTAEISAGRMGWGHIIREVV
jgi:hypothetical protein